MKRSLFSPPNPDTLSPLVAVLPTLGVLSKLETLGPSLFARLDAINEIIELGAPPESLNFLNSEKVMLRQVIDWLALANNTSGGANA